jgi:hypothetical protein
MAWLWNKHVNEIPDFIINQKIHQKNILQIIWGFIVFEGYRLAVDIPNAMRLTSKMPWTAIGILLEIITAFLLIYTPLKFCGRKLWHQRMHIFKK